MARRASKHPTELELEILKLLWREGPLTVRQVREGLVDFRRLAITSVTTVMNIMKDKGYLSRRKVNDVFAYEPLLKRKTAARRILDDTLRRVFDGSPSALMLNLLDVADIDAAEIARLQELLDRHEKGDAK